MKLKTPEPDGEGWIPILQAQQQRQGQNLAGDARTPDQRRQNSNNDRRNPNNALDDGRDEESSSIFGEPKLEPTTVVGPFVGVRSKEQPTIIERNIPNWQFTTELFQQPNTPGSNTGPKLTQGAVAAKVNPINADDIGRILPGQGANNPGAGGNGLGQGFNSGQGGALGSGGGGNVRPNPQNTGATPRGRN